MLEKSSISYSNVWATEWPIHWVSRRRRPRGLRELLHLPQSLVTTSPFFRLSTNLLLSSLLTVHPHLPLQSCSGSGNSFVDITSNQAQPLSNFLSHPTRPTTPSNSHWGEGAVRRLQAATPAKPSKLGERRREDTPVSAGEQTQCSVDRGD